MAPVKTPIGAEARGKLRRLKANLKASFDRGNRNIYSEAAARAFHQIRMRGSDIGKARALQKLCKLAGAGAHLERAEYSGSTPRIIWSRLVPRDSTVWETNDPGLRQDCIVCEYLAAMCEGIFADIWTVSFTDHAVGRLLQRAPKADPAKVMREAHRNILKASSKEMRPLMAASSYFLLPAGPGAFVCKVFAGTDESDNVVSVFVIARTYLDSDLMREDQKPITIAASDDEERLGDALLLPAPLRRMVATDDPAGGFTVGVQALGNESPAAGLLH